MRYGEYKQHINENVYQNASTGYVLTPSELANEMVSKLPDSVFESETTTFLDPICKSGTFLFEIIERLYDKGHSVSNIQSRIFTVDSNSHSLNIAKSVIRRILNKESDSFTFNTKIDFVEKYYNRLITLISKGKFKTFSDFLNIILLDKNDKHLMVLIKNNISDFISQYEKVSKLESKLFGEVFTSRQLIDEMLNTLPEDVWKNPDLKWLDPAVGIGNFPAAIMDRLMVGLEDVIGDESDRRKHILEEMLYFCDISIKNLFLLYMLFDKNNEFNLNVYRGSFLEEGFDNHMKSVWRLEGFDVVVGNPPYQEVYDNGKTKGGGKGGANNLWSKFFLKSKEISDNIILIHPPSFLSPNHKVLEKMYEDGGLKMLKIFDKSPFEGVSTQACYYHWLKGYDDLCNIGGYYIDLTTDILPNSSNPLDFSICNKFFNSNNILNFIRNCQIHTQSKKMYISDSLTEINKNKLYVGSKIKYTSLSMEEQNLNKVIVSRSGYLNPILDNNSCVSESNYYYVVDNNLEGNNLVNIIKSKLYDYCLKKTKFSGFFHGEVLKNIPKVDLTISWTDEELYKYFNLTQEEINLIEKQ